MYTPTARGGRAVGVMCNGDYIGSMGEGASPPPPRVPPPTFIPASAGLPVQMRPAWKATVVVVGI
jgi:hypothetical protein